MPEPVDILNTTGKACPLPILMTAKAILKLGVGDVLEVVGDDPAILDDMPIYCMRAGHDLLTLEEGEQGLIRCQIKKVHGDA